MIALDSNLLVYAHRADSDWNAAAHACIAELAEGQASWAIPWPCIHEFLAIVTHPRIYDPPSPLSTALDQVEAWMESPSLTLIAEDHGYEAQLASVLRDSRSRGARVHDARIAALCLHHGVTELWTADRDFSGFARLATRNPLANAG